MSSNNSSTRVRNWCAVVYPSEEWYKKHRPDGPYDGCDGWGSAPNDWMQRLDALNLKWTCSPLHDMDTDDDGCIKKPHWHIVISYGGNKSFEQVKDDLKELNCPIPQICRDVRSSVRYFVHLDHPHKYQYKQEDILNFGGFDTADCFKFSKSESDLFTLEMANFIEENNIFEFADFDSYCRRERSDTWYRVLSDQKTMYFKTLINSYRNKYAPKKEN